MLRYLTAGESHGEYLSAILEGMPAGVSISCAGIDRELIRRQGGYGRGGRMKIENDRIKITAGVRNGQSLGSPIGLLLANRDYANWRQIMAVEPFSQGVEAVTQPRPGHADLAGGIKYAQRDLRNILERSSARETAMRVAVGAIAKQLLADQGFDPAFGARPLKRAIQQKVLDPLALELLEGRIKAGDVVRVEVEQDRVVLRAGTLANAESP